MFVAKGRIKEGWTFPKKDGGTKEGVILNGEGGKNFQELCNAHHK